MYNKYKIDCNLNILRKKFPFTFMFFWKHWNWWMDWEWVRERERLGERERERERENEKWEKVDEG